jgi:hypothetical protein
LATCNPGDSPPQPLGGALNLPTGVAAGADGNVYVAEAGNTFGINAEVLRIQKFTSPPPGFSVDATPTAVVGGALSAEAEVTGGPGPGTLIFRAYAPGDASCAGAAVYTSSPVPVLGNAGYESSPAFIANAVGTYRWRAFYSGDPDHAPIASSCGDASSVVAPATPAVTAQATAAATLGQPIGVQATLAGGFSPAGSITFTVYGPGNPTCAFPPAYTSGNVVTVSGNGGYSNLPSFTPTAPGEYRWRVSYSGDASNSPAATACGGPNQLSTVSAAPGPTGQRAAAIKKCKKKKKRAARKRCMKRARRLPV